VTWGYGSADELSAVAALCDAPRGLVEIIRGWTA
jgi:hypothetical protein